MLIYTDMLKAVHKWAQSEPCHVLCLFPRAPAGDWQETLMSKPVKREIRGYLATWSAPKAVSSLSQHKGCLEMLDRIQHTWNLSRAKNIWGRSCCSTSARTRTHVACSGWGMCSWAQPAHCGDRICGKHLSVILAPLPRAKHCSQGQTDHLVSAAVPGITPTLRWQQEQVKRMIFTCMMMEMQRKYKKSSPSLFQPFAFQSSPGSIPRGLLQ